jgi:hypothetical protein
VVLGLHNLKHHHRSCTQQTTNVPRGNNRAVNRKVTGLMFNGLLYVLQSLEYLGLLRPALERNTFAPRINCRQPSSGANDKKSYSPCQISQAEHVLPGSVGISKSSSHTKPSSPGLKCAHVLHSLVIIPSPPTSKNKYVRRGQ